MDLICISQKIRKIRITQNITVEQLAQQSGFSKGFISQVENFRVTPSLNALNKIAGALGVSMADLFAQDTPEPEYTFSSISDGAEMFRDDNLKYGMRYFALAYRQIGRRLNPFLVEYTPASEDRGFLMHDTEEFFLLLEGHLEYCLVDERNRHIMSANDLLYMKANIPHRARLADGCRYAKALIVYSEMSE